MKETNTNTNTSMLTILHDEMQSAINLAGSNTNLDNDSRISRLAYPKAVAIRQHIAQVESLAKKLKDKYTERIETITSDGDVDVSEDGKPPAVVDAYGRTWQPRIAVRQTTKVDEEGVKEYLVRNQVPLKVVKLAWEKNTSVKETTFLEVREVKEGKVKVNDGTYRTLRRM